jgi:predicted DNA binding CopG/RHH family protein
MGKFTTWDELQKELFTPEEIAAGEKRVAAMFAKIDARNAKKAQAEREAKEISRFKRVIVGLDEPQLNAIDKIAKKRHISRSAFIREAVSKAVAGG